MADADDVCVLIPTLNEAETIGSVIEGFRDEGFERLFVMDGGSTDQTQAIAADHGATVKQQSGRGKGQAVREAIRLIDADVIVMVDGDGTYDPRDVHTMLEPILNGHAEHVIGNRFADMQPGAMTRLNRVGNWLINHAFTAIHGRHFKDILSGYRAFSRDSVRRFWLTADGFGIETEFAVECVKHDIPTAIVPITYRSRPAASSPNLHPIRDGGVILVTLYRLAKTNNPLFYFGSLGALSGLVGIGISIYVIFEWFYQGVSHQVLTLVAAIAVLFGVQLVVFGVLSDMILALYREQSDRIR